MTLLQGTIRLRGSAQSLGPSVGPRRDYDTKSGLVFSIRRTYQAALNPDRGRRTSAAARRIGSRQDCHGSGCVRKLTFAACMVAM